MWTSIGGALRSLPRDDVPDRPDGLPERGPMGRRPDPPLVQRDPRPGVARQDRQSRDLTHDLFDVVLSGTDEPREPAEGKPRDRHGDHQPSHGEAESWHEHLRGSSTDVVAHSTIHPMRSGRSELAEFGQSRLPEIRTRLGAIPRRSPSPPLLGQAAILTGDPGRALGEIIGVRRSPTIPLGIRGGSAFHASGIGIPKRGDTPPTISSNREPRGHIGAPPAYMSRPKRPRAPRRSYNRKLWMAV